MKMYCIGTTQLVVKEGTGSAPTTAVAAKNGSRRRAGPILPAVFAILFAAIPTGALRGDEPQKPSPLSIADAEPLVQKFILKEKPNLNPAAQFKIEEIKVDQLWDKLQTQLFLVRLIVGESEFNSYTLLCRKGEFRHFVATFGGDGLMSGVVVDDAFYYTYSFGSGIHRSHLGKLTVVKDELRTRETGGFIDRDLFVKKTGDKLAVEAAAFFDGSFKAFNSWTSAKPFGTIREEADSLQIIGLDGKPLAPNLSTSNFGD
jgi:hypothetical protein